MRLRYTGRGEETACWRLVEPHRLEVLRGHTYLRAYCRWRRGERVFRLDRISACGLAPPEGAPPFQGT